MSLAPMIYDPRQMVVGRIRRLLGRGTPVISKAYEPPELTAAQQRVLEALRSDGIAIVPFLELYDEPLWRNLDAEMREFAAFAAAETARGGTGGKKDYLVRRYPRGKSKLPTERAVLRSDGPWLRYAAGDPLLDVVNSYRGVKTKLVDFDQWYTIPVAEGSERHASQQWHRDPEDQHVVKVFLYFSDVDDDSGPFEYVRRSAAGGKYGDLWPWGESHRYPPSDELERRVDESDLVLATGPPGTLVVCDTSGFHRGGYGRSRPRVLATHTYVNRPVTPENKRRKFEVDWGDHDLSDQARFALS